MGRSSALRIVFAGTPEFAAVALDAIAAAGHEIVLVLTRADKPAGRGRALHESAVKRLARERGLAIEQPRSLRDEGLRQRLRALGADAMVVAAYGLILPGEVLRIPRHGCLNIHASLLPRWRGAAPIQRAIQAGDAETGVTIMQMDEGLDTGPMLLARREPIRPDDTGGTLHDRLASLGARAIVEALERLAAGTLRPQPQPADGVTYAHKLTRADALIDWTKPARRIVDQVRAFDPVPGAGALLERMPGSTIKVWSAIPEPFAAPGLPPGTALLAEPGRLVVACGDGAVALLELQRPGSRRLPAADFLRGCPIGAGERFVARAPTDEPGPGRVGSAGP